MHAHPGGPVRNLSVSLYIVMTLWVMGRYGYLTLTHQSNPTFSTWVVLAASVSLSFWSYLSTKTRNLVDNIGNMMDLMTVWSVIAILLVWRTDRVAAWRSVDIWLLVAAGAVFLYWRWTKQAWRANLCLQVLMAISYIPMYVTVWQSQQNPEPWSTWVPTWFTVAASMVPAYKPQAHVGHRDATWQDTFLPKAYATRGLISVTILLLLMAYKELA